MAFVPFFCEKKFFNLDIPLESPQALVKGGGIVALLDTETPLTSTPTVTSRSTPS